MVANELLIDGFKRVHEGVIAVVTGLEQKQLLYRPTKDANSIAWLVWHLARVEDDHIAHVAGTEQRWHSSWHKRFALPYPVDALGYGQTSDEVGQMNATTELLKEYYAEVHEQTIAFISALSEKDYQHEVDKNWDPPVTMAVRLISVLNDTTQHVGQAAYVRGILPQTL